MIDVQNWLLILLCSTIIGSICLTVGFRAGVRFCWDRRAKKILRGAWFKSIIKACNEGDREAKHRDHMNEAAARVMKTRRCPRCDLFYVLEEEERHQRECPKGIKPSAPGDIKFDLSKPWPAMTVYGPPPGPIPPAPPAPAPPTQR